MSHDRYGYLDTSYKAAGEKQGINKLCIDFYNFMGTLSEAKDIRAMHEDSLEVMTDKLTLFLCMWLGGPKDYKEKYNHLGMPMAHKHLVINEGEVSAWLLCMDKALDLQPFDQSFIDYLKVQFRFPAEMIRKHSLFE